MLYLRAYVCGLLLLGVSCLTACGGHHPLLAAADHPAPPAAAPSLPAPADLLKVAAQVDDQRWDQGSAYTSALPNSHVGSGGPSKGAPGKGGKHASAYTFSTLAMTPSWDPAQSASAKDAACVGYIFNGFDQYSGGAQIQTGWSTPPAFTNLWYALANFQTNHWDWFPCPAGGGALTLPSFAPYTAQDGRLFLEVMLLGTDAAQLNWVLVGDPITPVPYLDSDLNNDPLQRIAPLTVNFDATNSYTVGSTITTCDMDFDGDGAFDETGNTTGLFQHSYAPGDYTAVLRVTDNLGHTGTQSVAFHAINPTNQPPMANYTPLVASGNAPLTVSFDASTSADPDGQIVKYEWDFDGDGVFDYSSATPDATYAFATQGPNSVELRVTDNDLATATTFGVAICNDGWHYATVESGVNGVFDKLTLVEQGAAANARACVAYCDAADYTLHFVRSSTNNGMSWSAPVVVDGGGGVHAGYSPSLVIEPVTQDPYMTYGAYDSSSGADTQRYIRATSPTGAAWSAYTVVDTGSGLGADGQLALLGGKPVVATFYKAGYEGSAELRVYQATTMAGTTWNLEQTVGTAATGTEQLGRPTLLVPPGQSPLLVWRGQDSGHCNYYSAMALAADGSAWDPAVAFTNTVGLNAGDVSVAVAGGRPVAAIGDTSSGSSLYYLQADDATGGAWTKAPVKLDSGGTDGGGCSVAVVNGNPAIAYYDNNSSAIRYVVATDANGTAWNLPQIVDSAGEISLPLALTVMPNNVPLVVYCDATHSTVKAAAFY